MTSKLSTLTLLLLSTWLASCGGSGGSNPLSANGPVTPPVPLDQASSSIVATFNLNTATGYTGQDILYYNLLGQGDINGDGYDDLFLERLLILLLFDQ